MAGTTSSARAAVAMAALRQAEERTGARPVRLVALPAQVQSASSSPPAVQPAQVQPTQAQPAAVPSAPVAHSQAPVPGREELSRAEPLGMRTAQRSPLPVPHGLRELLPAGLPRGGVVQVTGSTALVLTMLAEAGGAQEVWTAVVGQPRIGLLAAAQTGVALDRLVLVPEPGAQTAAVLAALVDGVDVLVVGPAAALVAADRRRLVARARERGTVLVATTPWPGARTVLEVTGVRWRGLGAGTGRLLSRELSVRRADAAGLGGRARVELVLPTGDAPAPEPPPVRLVGRAS
ncbi:MAG: hypothetical protein ACTMIR_08825 [Cellulomonadaceae bacterium]